MEKIDLYRKIRDLEYELKLQKHISINNFIYGISLGIFVCLTALFIYTIIVTN